MKKNKGSVLSSLGIKFEHRKIHFCRPKNLFQISYWLQIYEYKRSYTVLCIVQSSLKSTLPITYPRVHQAKSSIFLFKKNSIDGFCSAKILLAPLTRFASAFQADVLRFFMRFWWGDLIFFFALLFTGSLQFKRSVYLFFWMRNFKLSGTAFFVLLTTDSAHHLTFNWGLCVKLEIRWFLGIVKSV